MLNKDSMSWLIKNVLFIVMHVRPKLCKNTFMKYHKSRAKVSRKLCPSKSEVVEINCRSIENDGSTN